MQQVTTLLDGLPGDVVDVDVNSGDEWLVACRNQVGDVVVATSAGEFPAPSDVRFPIARWMPGDRMLLVDSRTVEGRDNAYVFTRTGELVAQSCVGDGVQDVLIAGHRIVVTYFDEGVFGDVDPSSEGLCVFGDDLEMEFGYQSTLKDPVDIADCYCACLAGRHEVCFSPYTGFPLVRLNLKTREQTVLALPAEFAGASALATDGVDFFVYGPYDLKTTVFRWSPKHGEVTKVGTHSGPLRGYRRGTFIAPGLGGYTIVNVEAAAQQADGD